MITDFNSIHKPPAFFNVRSICRDQPATVDDQPVTVEPFQFTPSETVASEGSKISVTFSIALRYIDSVRLFREFYNKHKDRFFAYLMRSTGDYYLASDIMQESFTRYLERYGKDSQNTALLYTIGRHLIYDSARKQKRKARLQSEQMNPVDDHEHYLMVREQYRQVLSAMQTLEADERDILALAVSSQLPYREISSIAGISEANVKVKVHRARAKLRKIIQAGE